MDNQDRKAIEDLFSRLAEAEKQAGPKDTEANALIQEHIASMPGAPYLMAQTIVMQNLALEQAQQRITELEQDADEHEDNGGMFSGMFGGNRAQSRPQPRTSSVPSAGQRATGQPAGAGGAFTPQPQQAAGGGFLAGAAQTAMGVAGGVLLANALGGMFASDPAQAAPAEAAPADTPPPQDDAAMAEPAPDPSADDESGGGFFDSLFGGDDAGGDF